jgi:hypothetical protein
MGAAAQRRCECSRAGAVEYYSNTGAVGCSIAKETLGPSVRRPSVDWLSKLMDASSLSDLGWRQIISRAHWLARPT